MYRLTGEYECRIDVKGRVRLPASLIKQLGESGIPGFTVNRGFEKHLILYPKDVWEKKTTEINQLNIYNVKHRQAIRYFYRGATEVTLDSVDRILIPKSLLEYANIEKEAVLFAYQEQIEIWSKSKYEQMLGEEPEDFSELANEIFSKPFKSISDQNE